MSPAPGWRGTPAAPSSRAQMTSLGGTFAFRDGWVIAGVRPSSTVCFFWSSRCSSRTAIIPNFFENHRRVSQQSCNLCGVTSWDLRSFKSWRTWVSCQGMGRPHFTICSKTRHLWRSVLKRVSPRRSKNSWVSLSPRRGAKCGMPEAYGIRWERSLSAHFRRRWFSSTFWFTGPTSLIREGFQCLHLTSCKLVKGEGVKLLAHFSLSEISHRSWRSEYAVGSGPRGTTLQKVDHQLMYLHRISGVWIPSPHSCEGWGEDICERVCPDEPIANFFQSGLVINHQDITIHSWPEACQHEDMSIRLMRPEAMVSQRRLEPWG